MKFIIIAFAAGFILGFLLVYIWNRTHTSGAIAVYETEDGPTVVLELEEEFHKFRNKKIAGLRVENHSYYEN